MSIQRRVQTPPVVEATGPVLCEVRTPRGLQSVTEMRAELDGYVRVLTGDAPSPMDFGIIGLMEVGNVYHTRAREIEVLIHRGENDGDFKRGSTLMKFRTGELQSFLSIFRHACQLGSRRVTHAHAESWQS